MSLDIHYHSENILSIRDVGNNLNIADKHWDSIFNFCVRFKEAYFLGSRACDFDNELSNYIVSHLKEVDASTPNHFDILAKVNTSSLIINRSGISKLWEYYEFPSFIFCKNEIAIENLNSFLNNQTTYDDIISLLEDAMILFRNIESDVLWVQKGTKTNFPRF